MAGVIRYKDDSKLILTDGTFIYAEDDTLIYLSDAQRKLAAIRARINGIWDHPALESYVLATTDSVSADILTILNA